ncbi:MAG: transporter [Thermodesulfobacteriota bacterium]
MAHNVRLWLVGLVVVILFCGSGITYGQTSNTDELYAEIGFNFYTGDYGTNTDTDTYTVPLILGYSPSQLWDFYLSIPYIHQSTTGTVTVAGKPVRVKKNMTGGTSTITQQYIDTTSHSGLGDICLGGSYTVFEETSDGPAIYALASIKFPTADEEKGLGTGEYDYGLGVGLDKRIGKWTLFGNAKYNIIGSPGGIDLDNFFSVVAGVSHQCTTAFKGSVSIYAAESASAESDSPFEISLSGEYVIDNDNKASVYVTKGLSDGSPDYGLGVVLTHYF